jgi:hypothetical protein
MAQRQSAVPLHSYFFDNMPVRVTEGVATVLDDLAPSIAEAAFKLIAYTRAG